MRKQFIVYSKHERTKLANLQNEVANSMYQRSELDWLIYNDPLSYAELILNGDPEMYLKAVTKQTPLD